MRYADQAMNICRKTVAASDRPNNTTKKHLVSVEPISRGRDSNKPLVSFQLVRLIQERDQFPACFLALRRNTKQIVTRPLIRRGGENVSLPKKNMTEIHSYILSRLIHLPDL